MLDNSPAYLLHKLVFEMDRAADLGLLGPPMKPTT